VTTPTFKVGQEVRLAGRRYHVVNPSVTTTDGQSGLVLLASLSRSRGGAAGEGELVAVPPEDLAAQQVTPTHHRRRPHERNRGKAFDRGAVDRGKASTEGQTPCTSSIPPKPPTLQWLKPPSTVTVVDVLAFLAGFLLLLWVLT
jgi:hypothetical protein